MSIRSKIFKLKGGHPIILSRGKRDAYIENLRKQYKDWHKIGALSPYSIPNGEKRQQKRESKVSPDIVSFLKNNDVYDEAIFSWPNWRHYIVQARKTMRPEKPPKPVRVRKTKQRKTVYIPKGKVFTNRIGPSGLSESNDGKWVDHQRKQGMSDDMIKQLLEIRREMRKEGFS